MLALAFLFIILITLMIWFVRDDLLEKIGYLSHIDVEHETKIEKLNQRILQLEKPDNYDKEQVHSHILKVKEITNAQELFDSLPYRWDAKGNPLNKDTEEITGVGKSEINKFPFDQDAISPARKENPNLEVKYPSQGSFIPAEPSLPPPIPPKSKKKKKR